MLTVPLLISLLRISSSSSCDDMPCALYHMLFAVVKGGKTLSGDVQIRSRKQKRAINSQHSFRENQRMLLAAHRSDSKNSLFKARATAHRR